jgi:D-aspartate ligase
VTIVDTTVPVVVVTVSPAFLLHGVMGIVRSLGRLGLDVYLDVYVVHDDRWAPPDFSRYLAGKFTTTLDDTAPDGFLKELLDVGRKIGRRSVLIPVDDVTALFVDDHAETLKAWFIFPDRPAGLARSLSSKQELGLLCRRLGIPTPEMAVPQSHGDVAAFAEQAAFPVVVKAIDPMLLRQRVGTKSVVIVQDPDALLEAYETMEVDGIPHSLLQEYIPGDPDSIWMFNGYFDNRSECLFGFTGTKLRRYPPYTGPACIAVCRRNPPLEQATKDFLKGIGYRGIVDLRYRYDARDGGYKLLDVNPRIGATFRLFTATNGMDVARALNLDLTGQAVPASVGLDGRKWVVEHHDLLASRQYHRDGRLSLKDWAWSLRGIQEAAWFAWDDPAPFVAMGRRSALIAVRRARERKAVGMRSEPGRSATPGQRTDPTPGRQQRLVNMYFEELTPFWRDVYHDHSVFGAIHRYRQALALRWVDRLQLPEGAPVLEVGSGAALTSVVLAERGLQVQAIDPAPSMLALTRRQAAEAGVGSRLHVTRGDVHALPYVDGTFYFVLALGVIPWLHSSSEAVREMARVLRPGGHLLLNADNRARLSHLVDPRFNPMLEPARQAVKSGLLALGLRRPADRPVATFHRLDEFDRLITVAGLERVAGSTYGFGPFTFLGRELLPPGAGVKLHGWLQKWAERDLPVLRSTGAQCFIIARKPSAPATGNGDLAHDCGDGAQDRRMARDRPLELPFPEDWDVTTWWPATPSPLNEDQIVRALDQPVGQPPIRKLALGRSRPLIIVDDLTRPTPASRVLPFLLRHLAEAGVPSASVRIVVGTGTHAPPSPDSIAKKVGPEASACRLLVHDHVGDVTRIGRTSFGTPVSVNREVLASDLVIGVGGIYPQHSTGFGGGSKLALSVLGKRSIIALHYGHPSVGGSYDVRSDFRRDLDEIAAMIGLHTSVSLHVDAARQLIRVVSGDHRRYYDEAVAFAMQAYLAPLPRDADVVVSNAYPMDASLTFMRSKGILPLLHAKPGASRVVVAPCSEGVGHHGLFPFVNAPRFQRQRHFMRVVATTPSKAPLKGARLVSRKVGSVLGQAVRRDQPASPGSAEVVPGGRTAPIWLFAVGQPPGSLPAKIPGMVAVYEWSEILQRIRHEQAGRSGLKVVAYPCAPLQVLDMSGSRDGPRPGGSPGDAAIETPPASRTT